METKALTWAFSMSDRASKAFVKHFADGQEAKVKITVACQPLTCPVRAKTELINSIDAAMTERGWERDGANDRTVNT